MKIELEATFLYRAVRQIDVDYIDRLNNKYTTIGLVACFLLITTKIYVGHPINCLAPTQFPSSHVTYVNSICWLQGTYYLPTNEIQIPDMTQPRTYFISYYQWTSIIILVLAVLFTIPTQCWHTFSVSNGINIKTVIEMIEHDRNDHEKASNIMRLIRWQLQMSNDSRRKNSISRQFRAKKYITRLTLLLFLTKFLYLVITIGEFVFLVNFFSLHRYTIDFQISKTNFPNRIFESESLIFPHVVMCDFMVRQLGSNQHWHAVQCNLPINLFNRVIFTGFILWLIFLIVLNVMSIIFWAYSLMHANRRRCIEQCLKFYPNSQMGTLLENCERSKTNFVDYIGLDGFIILRIIEHNIDKVFMIKTIGYLHQFYDSSSDVTIDNAV